MSGLVAEFELAENLRRATARFCASSALADISDLHVFADRQAAKQPHRLERPHDAGMRKAVAGQSSAIALARKKTAGQGPLKAGKDIDQRGFAGAVRTDEAEDLAALERHADVIHGDEAAETDGYAARLKRHVKRPCGGRVIAAAKTSPPKSG